MVVDAVAQSLIVDRKPPDHTTRQGTGTMARGRESGLAVQRRQKRIAKLQLENGRLRNMLETAEKQNGRQC